MLSVKLKLELYAGAAMKYYHTSWHCLKQNTFLFPSTGDLRAKVKRIFLKNKIDYEQLIRIDLWAEQGSKLKAQVINVKG